MSQQAKFKEAAQTGQSSLVGELFQFIRQNKKWWLTPIVLFVLLFGGLAFLAGTGAGPFIYTLF